MDKLNTVLDKFDKSISKNFTKKELCYYVHQHPLILWNAIKYSSPLEKSCSQCKLPIHDSTDTFFRCNRCPNDYLFLHKSCAGGEYPQEIFHPLHRKHPLKHSLLEYEYHPTSTNYTQCCNICCLPIRRHTYTCFECDFNLHSSCAQLPLAIRDHPLHPHDHDLYLCIPSRISHNKSETCMICAKDSHGYIYSCHECYHFSAHVTCISLVAKINVGEKNHIHELALFEGMLDVLFDFYQPKVNYHCNTCNSSITSLPFARCVECRLSYHVHCVFPTQIRTQHHVHSLMVDICDEVVVPMDDPLDNVFYCDACEDLRDPHQTAYGCLECDYVAHIDCAFSREVCILKEDPIFLYKLDDEDQLDPFEANAISAAKELFAGKLRNENKQEMNGNGDEARTLKDFLLSITDDEVTEIGDILEVTKTKMVDARGIFLKDYQEGNGKTAKRALHLDATTKHFLKELDNQTKRPDFNLQDLQRNGYLVSVGNYIVPKKHSERLRSLLLKRGDIGARSTLSNTSKRYVTLLVCKAMDSIWKTMFDNVTVTLLVEWWNIFNFAHCAGFQVQFAFDILKRLLRAQFARFVDDFTYRTLADIDEEISDVIKECSNLQAICEPYREFTKSIFFKECLVEASALEKQKACIIDLF